MVSPFWGDMIWFDLNCTSWKIHFNISIWMYKYLTISIIRVDVDEMEIHTFWRYFIFYSIPETKFLPLISPEILATEWLKRFSWWLSLILWRVDTEGRFKCNESYTKKSFSALNKTNVHLIQQIKRSETGQLYTQSSIFAHLLQDVIQNWGFLYVLVQPTLSYRWDIWIYTVSTKNVVLSGCRSGWKYLFVCNK